MINLKLKLQKQKYKTKAISFPKCQTPFLPSGSCLNELISHLISFIFIHNHVSLKTVTVFVDIKIGLTNKAGK